MLHEDLSYCQMREKKKNVHCQKGGTDDELPPPVSRGVVVVGIEDSDKGGPGSEEDHEMPASEKCCR